MEIKQGFKKVFSELENGHIKVRERLNAYSERERSLEDVLFEELNLFEPWRFKLMDELGAITDSFDVEQREQYRWYVQDTKYFQIVQEAPFYARIINKPNGYAGDAYMMSYIYQNRFEGETPFGMFLHKHALTTKACQSVRNRKNHLKQEILKMTGGKVLSLAAGPAQEIKEIIQNSNGHDYQFLALDHDMDTLQKFNIPQPDPRFRYALANAFQIIQGNYMTARPRTLLRQYCSPRKDFNGFRRIWNSLKYEVMFLNKDEYDLVYSVGLYDYIRTYILDDNRGTIALTRKLFDLVKPGGILMVGNFNRNNPRDAKFMMEYVYDWQLIYRDRQEMMELTRAIPPEQIERIEVLEEPLGINYLLKVEKKKPRP